MQRRSKGAEPFVRKMTRRFFKNRCYDEQALLPPGRELTSAQWIQSLGLFNFSRARLVPGDPPFSATFAEQVFQAPHPELEKGYWRRRVAETPGTYVLEIPFGRTIGARGAVITDDNVVINDLSETPWEGSEHYLLTEPQEPPTKLRRLKGTYALLHGFGTSAYHWIYDTLPRFEVLRRAGYDLEAFDGFFLRHPKYEPHYEALTLLGIPEEKIVWCTKTSHYGCERLVVPSFTTNRDENTERDHHPWVFPFLASLGPADPPTRRRRLLVNRKDSRAGTRQIVNQAELTALLQGYDFEEVTLGELEFSEQARLFKSAELIVAAHGGGLSNLCFCEPSTRLLELFAPDYVLTHFRNIARQLGIGYQPLVMEAVEEAAGTAETTGTFGGDIRVNLQQVEALIKTMLEDGEESL